jgi:hypothetical protein
MSVSSVSSAVLVRKTANRCRSTSTPLLLIKENKASDCGGVLGDALLLLFLLLRRTFLWCAEAWTDPRGTFVRLYCCASQSLCFWFELTRFQALALHLAALALFALLQPNGIFFLLCFFKQVKSTLFASFHRQCSVHDNLIVTRTCV